MREKRAFLNKNIGRSKGTNIGGFYQKKPFSDLKNVFNRINGVQKGKYRADLKI